ncbi:MAG: ATP-dependent exoDNAse (exonuclease V) beta subunit, partial [Flavobacteriales bacterium]
MAKVPSSKFKVLRASAGSGKTYALVRHYLSACLLNEDASYFKHILAITFTNKAADEMKERVIDTMKSIANGGDSMVKELTKELSVTEDVLRKKSREIYLRMMTNYGQIAIMTIDKFVNRLVKSFAFDLQFDGDYRIELDDTQIIENGVDELLSEVGNNEQLTMLLETFVEHKVESEASWKVRDDLVKFGKLLFKEDVKPIVSALTNVETKVFIELHHAYLKEYYAAKKLAISAAQKASELLTTNQLESAFSGNYIPKFFSAIAKSNFKEPSTTIRGQFAGDKEMCAKKEEEQIKSAVAAITPQLVGYFETILAFSEGESGGIIQLKKTLADHLLQLAVLKQLNDVVGNIQLQSNAFTFSDLNQKIQSIVQENPAPFIYERLGERYHHFLIDEFQDTSVVQWQNFLPLVENALAKGNFNLVVGDGKQAIYRWRNGDVRQLQQLPELIRPENLEPQSLQEEVFYERENALKRNYLGEVLPDNWRSAVEVVNFNNQLFNHLAKLLPSYQTSIYAEQAQNPKGVDGGWVTIEAYAHRTKAELEPDRNERIVELVKLQKEHGYRYKDVAILVRKRADGSSIAQALLDANIQTITDESLSLGSHAAPRAVMALMKALSNESNEGAAVEFVQCLCAIRPELEPHKVFEKYITLPKEKWDRSSFNLNQFLADQLPALKVEQLMELTIFEFMNLVCQVLG